MNLFALNGGALNGTVFSLVLATASIACSASVNAVAIRTQDALAPTFSAAYVVADATRTAQGVAFVDGVANAYPTPTHTQSAAAPISASANMSAFVLRVVQGQATANCTAEVSAVVASFQGGAAVSGAASVSADATRVQAALAGLSGVATVTITAAPTVYRMVSAAAQGTASLRVEYAINGVAGAYVNVSGTAELAVADVGVVYRMAAAAADCAAQSQATATQILPGQSVVIAIAAIVSPDPFIGLGGLATVNGAATVTAQADRVLQPLASLSATALVQGSALQQHSASAGLDVAAELAATAKVTQYAQANAALGAAGMTATAQRVLVPVAALDASASLTPDATRTAFGSATALLGTADLAADATRETFAEATATLGTAAMTGEATRGVEAAVDLLGSVDAVVDGVRGVRPEVVMDMAAGVDAQATRVVLAQAEAQGMALGEAVAVRVPQGASALSGTVELVPDATRQTFASATATLGIAGLTADLTIEQQAQSVATLGAASVVASATRVLQPVALINATVELSAAGQYTRYAQAEILGSVTVYADTVTNPAAYDPPERTFTRQSVVIDFLRYAPDTEFRRAA